MAITLVAAPQMVHTVAPRDCRNGLGRALRQQSLRSLDEWSHWSTTAFTMIAVISDARPLVTVPHY
jgi:hypothetical protein